VNSPTDLPRFENDLRQRVRGGVMMDRVSRGIYATDASNYQIMPVAVCTPLDADDVAAALDVAREHGVTILPRGGGTSLAGQTVGASLVLDFSKHMNRILELNVEEHWARVEPGLVRDEFNAQLASHGLHFAPDPATANRANVGGMVGNNTSGMRSIIYGKTIDHVLEAVVLLADGTRIHLRELDPEAYAERATGDGREAEILAGARRIIEANHDEIEQRFPKVMRRVGGYPLDEFIHADNWNLAKLIVGSEGTLAATLEVKVRLEPLPKHIAVSVVQFGNLIETIRAVKPILDYGPSAVEIIDRETIELARKNLASRPLCTFIEGDPAAVLIVEFFGDTEDEARGKAERMIQGLRAEGLGYAWPLWTDPRQISNVWGVRKSGLGLMLGMKGDRKPTPFIEDACIPVEDLPEYIDKVLQICRRLETKVAMYAHASVGVIHVRPILDLRREGDIERMKTIAEETFGLVQHYKGSWSSEHGDGLVRSPWMERFYGPRIYQAFREIKQLFDPDWRMNPGKIIDSPPMDQALRFGTTYRTPDFPTVYHFREDGGFASAVHMCSGVGACRKTLGGTMCPSYMVTRDEEHTTRGRANALRLAMSGQFGPGGLTDPRLYDAFDLCLSCKGCKAECPSNVDLAKLRGEFLRIYREKQGVKMRDRMVLRSPAMAARLSGRAAPLINALMSSAAARRLLDATVGLDRRRRPPRYAAQSFSRWSEQRKESDNGDGRRVVLFVDTYTNYHEPHIGKAATELLESCGYHVIMALVGCCQRPAISHGFLREAKAAGEVTMRTLDSYVGQGLPIVALEPSCASALTDDLPDLLDDADLGRRVAENVMMIDVFLDREVQAGRLDGAFDSTSRSVLIHGHCHQKALYGTDAMKRLLGRIEGLEVSEVDSGCCGMAGSFGYEKEHYDLSRKMAERRLIPAVRERAPGTTVVACGFSCRHQIADFAGVKALHWVEALRGASGGAE